MRTLAHLVCLALALIPLASPAAEPALGGNCAVCLKESGQRVVGQPRYSATHAGRLYLFPDAGARQKFLSNPTDYTSLDLAQGGECVVCAKLAGQRMSGKPEFASIYKGMRYLFPSVKERSMFDASPADFQVSSKRAGENMKAVAAPANEIRVVGTTACAGCAFGVRPLKDSGSLGIAVVSNDVVYVIEGGEAKYPKLFDERFDEVRVELVGSVKKQQGKFVWIEPSSLTKTR